MDKRLQSLSVGDIACARKLGPHTRDMSWDNLQDLLVDAVVTKIGRKYMTVKIGVYEYQFELNTGIQKDSKYSADYFLFPSREEAVDHTKQEFLFWRMRNRLEHLFWGLSKYTAKNSSIRNIPVSDWEAAARIFGIDFPWSAETEPGGAN